jgi:lysophospholipase L1-like esterase
VYVTGKGMTMAAKRAAVCILLLAAGYSRAGAGQPADPDPNRFAQEIKAFAEWDGKNAVPAEPVLFVGSSSIRLWRTHESFPDLPVINRGFGGSQISDILHFADRVVLPYQAKVIVFYAGSNDIAAGKSAQRVFEDCRRFVRLVYAGQPAARVVVLGINPCRSRWPLWPEMKKANELIQEFCKGDSRLAFADFGASFLSADGTPDSSLFLDDQLHLNAKGYAVWTKALAPVLQKILTPTPRAGGK